MKNILRKHLVILWLILPVLAACTPVRSAQGIPPGTGTSNSIATPLPPAQAAELGVLGKGSAKDMAWSPDGSLLAVGSTSGGYIYDTRSWQLLKTIPVNTLEDKAIGLLTFAPDGKNVLFLSWSYQPSLMRYDLQSGNIETLFDFKDLLVDGMPVFSPDGKTFALLTSTCNQNGVEGCLYGLELRDGTTGQLLHQMLENFPTENNMINSIVFSPDGKLLAVGGDENLIRVWDVSSGKLLYELQHDSDVLELCFSPDGSVLASASADATVRFWDTHTGKNLYTLHGFKQPLQHVAYFQGGRKLVVGSLDGSFAEWSLDEKFLPAMPLAVSMDAGKQLNYYGFSPDYTSMKTSPDSRRMATLVNSTVRIWDLETGTSILTIPEYNGQISSMAVSPENNLLAMGDSNLHIWQVNPIRFVTTLEVNGQQIQDIAFRPDGRQVAVATDDGKVQIWDVPGRRKTREYSDDADWCRISQLAFSPDGARLATAGWCGIRIWDATTGKLEQKMKANDNDEARELAFSPDGNRIIYVDTHDIWSWNANTGALIYEVKSPGDSQYWSVALRPDLMVLGETNDGPFLFFDPVTGRHLYDFAEGRGGDAVALSPDGRLLARSDYSKILLADSITGKALLTIDFRLPYFISFSPDGRFLFASSYEETTHVWDISTVYQLADSTPSLTATPGPTITVTPTGTPVVYPTLPVVSQTPAAPQSNSITADNVSRLEKLGEVGRGQAQTAAWSPDGKLFALGGTHGVYVFKSGTYQTYRFLPSGTDIFYMAFSNDGSLLAGQISNSAVQVWDVDDGRSLYTLDDIGCWNQGMVFSSDKATLTADCGGDMYVWSMATGQLLHKDSTKYYSDTSPDGKFNLEANQVNARLLDASTNEIIKTFEVQSMSPCCAAFSPDGKSLLVWYYRFEVARTGIYIPGKDLKSVAQLWNINPGQEPSLRATLDTGKWHQDFGLRFLGRFEGFAFTTDSRRLATASGDGFTQVWDTNTGHLLYTLPGGELVSFSPDGKQLVSLGHKVVDITTIWDVTPGHKPSVASKPKGFGDYQSFLMFTNDGKGMVSASDITYRSWTLTDGILQENPKLIELPTGSTGKLSASPNGKLLAYITSSELVLGVNDANHPAWQALEKFAGPKPYYFTLALAFSPDSTLLASADPDKKVRLWHIGQAKPVVLATDLYPENLLFSRDGRLLLVSEGIGTSATTVELWDTQTGERIRTWDVMGGLDVFDPDGATLVSADYVTGTIRILDIRSGKIKREMKGSLYPRSMAISPDGSLLVTNTEDGAEFWDVESGQLLRIVDINNGVPAFSADGRTLVISTFDGVIQYWGLPVIP